MTTSTAAIRAEYVRVRALVQRVSEASVTVDGDEIARIGRGLLVLLGVRGEDGPEQADRLAGKLERLRVFEDDEGRMNLSVRDVGGGMLLVPQFTLAADTQKGTRPSFSSAAVPEEGRRLFEALVARARASYAPLGIGSFGADMQVSLTNDGPVTFWLRVRPAAVGAR